MFGHLFTSTEFFLAFKWEFERVHIFWQKSLSNSVVAFKNYFNKEWPKSIWVYMLTLICLGFHWNDWEEIYLPSTQS